MLATQAVMVVALGLALLGPQGVRGARGSLHCAERRDISPCTCSPMWRATMTIDVMCERMTSFGQVLTALRGRFQPGVQIALSISYSQLDDFPERGFDELGLPVSKLTLRGNKISQLPEEAFAGLNGTRYLNLADNALPAIPTAVLALMPRVQTLDVSFSRLTTVRTQDLQGLPVLETLSLAGNSISMLEKDSMPRTLKKIHLGSNQLRHLNGTLRELVALNWLFLSLNHLTSLDGELPERGIENLILVTVAHNRLVRLPDVLRLCPRLVTILASNNSIVSLNGVFSRARRLQQLELDHNMLKALAEDDFTEAENLEELNLSHNEIESLNSALLRLHSLHTLNLSYNLMTEFSLQEIRGLQRLKLVDLGHNLVVKLGGRMENVVDSETRVEELRLEYNALVSLDGALSGVQGLERLNLSHNLLASISPDDLIGLDQLKMLDVSFNRLHTLEETSKTFMPALEELMASHNQLQALERDFHGLPALCRADLSSNNISRIHPELTARTRCKVHGVNSVLRIALNDNPVRCDEQLARTLIAFQSNLTELQGVPTCTLALPHMLLLSVGVPASLPVASLSGVLPALYSAGVPGVMGVANPPALLLSGYPLAPLQPLIPEAVITTTTTSTTTTTPAPPPPATDPTPPPTPTPTPSEPESTTDMLDSTTQTIMLTTAVTTVEAIPSVTTTKTATGTSIADKVDSAAESKPAPDLEKEREPDDSLFRPVSTVSDSVRDDLIAPLIPAPEQNDRSVAVLPEKDDRLFVRVPVPAKEGTEVVPPVSAPEQDDRLVVPVPAPEQVDRVVLPTPAPEKDDRLVIPVPSPDDDRLVVPVLAPEQDDRIEVRVPASDLINREVVPIQVPSEQEDRQGVPVSEPDQDERMVVPVLKELPPVIQLLKPEVSVQPSKDLPRLVDPELIVLAAAPRALSPSTPFTSPPPPPAAPSSQSLQDSPEGSSSQAESVQSSNEGSESEEAGVPAIAEPVLSTTPTAAFPAKVPASAPPVTPLEPMAADSPPDVAEPLILIKLLNDTALTAPQA